MADKITLAARPTIKFGWLEFLGVVLVVLKLNPGGHLDSDVTGWPWWLVTLPFWVFWAITLAVLLIGGVLGALGVAVVSILDTFDRARSRKRRAKRIAEQRAMRNNKGITNF